MKTPSHLLLDTHILLWWLEDNLSLTKAAKQAIADPNRIVFVSSASIWEIAIKTKIGKLQIPSGLEKILLKNHFTELPINFAHAAKTGDIPMHHHDPFDRTLIAQALVENLTIVTHYRHFAAYNVPILQI